MSKEKTAFEILANTLKAMAKQCTAKVKDNRAALMAVFISKTDENAYASHGTGQGPLRQQLQELARPERRRHRNRDGVRMIEKATVIKDAIMTAAVIAVVVGVLCFAAGGV